jgi:hypothetical protein
LLRVSAGVTHPLAPLARAWTAAENAGLELWSGPEPLDRPRDRWLAERIVERKATTRAMGRDGLQIDFSLVMQGFDFETVWPERREFRVEDAVVPTARLLHIVQSKQAAGRDKDKLFLAAHLEALKDLLQRPDEE